MQSVSEDKFHKIWQNAKILDEEFVNKDYFFKALHKNGILFDDPRIKDMISKFELYESKVTKEEFIECIGEDTNIIKKSMTEKFIIPEFQNFHHKIKGIFDECKNDNSGKVADYIPELAKADPKFWGVSVCTIDG